MPVRFRTFGASATDTDDHDESTRTERMLRKATCSAIALACPLILGMLIGMPLSESDVPITSTSSSISSVAHAVPHTISAVDHPFDPDWPDVLLILRNKCTGCHRPGSDETDYTTYDKLINARNEDGERVIVPGRPEKSLLWNQVCWNVRAERDSRLPDTPEMPPESDEWLTDGQLRTIYQWIERGALEYTLPKTCNTRPLMEIDFPSARQCKTCHPKQYSEWSRSMHAYAQHSPIFEAFNLTLQERTSGTIGTFCTRCHTPIGTALGENGLRRNVHRSRLSMEGVTCVVCHRQKDPYYKSNARTAIEPGALLDTCMYGPFEDAVTLDGVHPSKGKAHIKSAAFCGACHDVTSPEGVRLEEAFSEWQNSPAAKQGQTCHACHMGPVQGRPVPDSHRPLGRAAVVPGVPKERIPLRPLSDHTFAGPDYSMLPDTEFPEKLDWMYEVDYRDHDRLTPYQQRSLEKLRRRNRKSLRIAKEKRLELLANAAHIDVHVPESAVAGEKIKLRVDVTSDTAGHSFPTGFTAERQVWVEVLVRDLAGNVVFHSGKLDPNGDLLVSHSHCVEAGKLKYDKHLLNFQNKFIALTFRGTERSVVVSVNRDVAPINIVRPARGISAAQGRPQTFRIAKGSIPPLGTIGRDYKLRVPPGCGDLVVDVRLNFRHLPPALLDGIGVPQLKHLLEIVVIDEYRSIIRIDSPLGGESQGLRLFAPVTQGLSR
ncbi:MAG: hypothetical protein MI757_13985 [Pirellulales bacterium]|nr:hypothetical protein [Pirellulales bacterium]